MERIVTLDIESTCAVPDCTDSQCTHALSAHTCRITCVGVYDEANGPRFKVFRGDYTELVPYLQSIGCTGLNGANLKWDIKILHLHGIDLPIKWYVDDVCLMATASFYKVSDSYEAWYNERRKEEN